MIKTQIAPFSGRGCLRRIFQLKVEEKSKACISQEAVRTKQKKLFLRYSWHPWMVNLGMKFATIGLYDYKTKYFMDDTILKADNNSLH